MYELSGKYQRCPNFKYGKINRVLETIWILIIDMSKHPRKMTF